MSFTTIVFNYCCFHWWENHFVLISLNYLTDIPFLITNSIKTFMFTKMNNASGKKQTRMVSQTLEDCMDSVKFLKRIRKLYNVRRSRIEVAYNFHGEVIIDGKDGHSLNVRRSRIEVAYNFHGEEVIIDGKDGHSLNVAFHELRNLTKMVVQGRYSRL